jgi:hypothetical protein
MAIFNSYVTNYRRVISLFLFTISRIISHAVPEGRISQSASDVNNCISEVVSSSIRKFNRYYLLTYLVVHPTYIVRVHKPNYKWINPT